MRDTVTRAARTARATRAHRRKSRRKKNAGIPLMRICVYALCTALIMGTCIAVPLLMVWKQAYITALSLERAVLKDSIGVLEREIAGLNVSIQDYSRPERIEAIALKKLSLIYPLPTDIVIVRPPESVREHPSAGVTLKSLLKKSLALEKG